MHENSPSKTIGLSHLFLYRVSGVFFYTFLAKYNRGFFRKFVKPFTEYSQN